MFRNNKNIRPATPVRRGRDPPGSIFANRVVAQLVQAALRIRRELFIGFSAICTHKGCVLARVSDGTIICGCHGAEFSITDGSVTKGPATTPLPKTEIKVEGDDIKLV